MKQCSVCKRSYTDEMLSYCLEDGAALLPVPESNSFQNPPAVTQPSQRVNYNPTPTMRVPPGQFISSPLINNSAAPTRNNRWIMFTGIGLLFVILGGAILTLLFVSGRNRTAVSNSDQIIYTAANNNVTEKKEIVSSSPVSTPAPTASRLVGMWKTSVVENKVPMDITVTFNAEGTSKFLFRNKSGRTATDNGTWQYSDGTLYEHYSNGASGKGSVKWIDEDNIDLTIIDNGVPAYSGLVRHYHRIK